MVSKFPGRALGLLPARHDARTYSLRPVLSSRLPDPPTVADWSLNVPYRMWRNDTLGDCAFAAHAALVSTWTKASQGVVVLTDDEVVANYAAVTGYDPAAGANDDGTVLLNMLQFWRRVGLSRPGQTLDYLTAYGSISPQDIPSIKRAIAYLGGVLAGIQVPRGFMTLPFGNSWDITKLSGIDLEPVGGHAIAVTGYSPYGVFFNTWGNRTFMTWRTFSVIADEAYGLLSRENWLGIPGTSPKGEDFDALVAELRAA